MRRYLRLVGVGLLGLAGISLIPVAYALVKGSETVLNQPAELFLAPFLVLLGVGLRLIDHST